MTTAIAEPETQTESTVERVTFQSKNPDTRLVRRPVREVGDGSGTKKRLTYEEFLEEQQAVNRAREANGRDPEPIDDTPWEVEFTGNPSQFVVPDAIPGVSPKGQQAIIDWLRSHPKLNFNGPSGFIEVETPLHLREPTTVEQMREVEQSLLHRDLVRAEACLEVEEETHRRPDVLKAAAAAIDGLRGLSADGAQDADPGNGARSRESSSAD